MIKRIHLHNFQIHREKTLLLTAGLNTITGQSDTGKSAIIRAIEWVRNNRPAGIGFINYAADECWVEIETDRGTVRRTRTRTTNSYTVNGVEHLGVGTAVPEEVEIVLNLGDVNVQPQHAPYFLLTLSSGQIAQELAHYADISEGNRVIKKVAQERRTTENIIKRQEQELSLARTKIKQLARIQTLSPKLQEVQQREEQIHQIAEQCKTITEYTSKLVGCNQTLSALVGFPDAGPIQQLVQEIQQRTAQIQTLQSLLQKIQAQTQWAAVDVTNQHKQIQIVEQLQNMWQSTKDKQDGVRPVTLKLQQCVQMLSEWEEDERYLRVQLQGFIGQVCSLCGQVITEVAHVG